MIQARYKNQKNAKLKTFIVIFLFLFVSCSHLHPSLNENTYRVLILYDSTYGSTEKISHWIAEGVREKNNFDVQTIKVTKISNSGELEGYNFILLGGPIYKGDISDRMKKFVKKNNSTFSKYPLGIFVVCGTYLIHGDRWISKFEKCLGKTVLIKKAFGGRLIPDQLIFEHRKRLESYWKDRGVEKIKGFDCLSEKDAFKFGKKIREEILK